MTRMSECGIGRAKTAEPIKLPFETMNEVGTRNRVLDRCRDQSREGHVLLSIC